MPSPMIDRYHDELRAKLSRRLKRIGGILMIVVGCVEVLLCLLVVSAPSFYRDFAGSRSLPHLALAMLLIIGGGIVVYKNQEDR